jgi:signal peptidase I
MERWMEETIDETPAPEAAEGEAKKKEEGSFLGFLLKLVIAVLIFRSFIFSPFSIPSESMLPRLWTGDYLLASKWSYGYTKNSLPYSVPLIPGRIFGSTPEPGDIAIFKHPIDGADYIKRVIGLPGDQIQMIDGVLHINGTAVPKRKIDDFVQPISQMMIDDAEEKNRSSPCAAPQFEDENEAGARFCSYPQFRETLPNNVSYNVLDLGTVAYHPYDVDPDNTTVYIVGEGELFMMGDNRDNSLDSRFPAVPGQGVGLVPEENLVGKASLMMWSTDGSSEWILPWTWFTAARWDRMGDGI